MRKVTYGVLVCVLFATQIAVQAESDLETAANDTKVLSGMSVLGNNEAPKSLVIVPWKTSEIGSGIGVTDSLDRRARPVDREVFLREIDYWQLREDGASGAQPAAP